MNLLIATFSFFAVLHAQERSSFETMLEQDTSQSSTESWVEIKNTRYRKIEFEHGRYYLQFKTPKDTTVQIYCTPPAGFEKEILILHQPEVTKRKREFVQVIHENCKDAKGAKTLTLNPAIGLKYPEDPKEAD
jgi:hypothetical protein